MNYPALSSVQFVPLYILFLARSLFDRRPRDFFGAVVSFGLLAIGSYYYAFYAAAITLVVVLVFGLRRRRSLTSVATSFRERLRQPRVAAGTAATAAAVLGLTAFLAVKPLQLYLDNRAAFERPLSEAVRYSARPWAWVTPGIDHPLFGDNLASFYANHLHDAPVSEQALYLGLVPLVLAVLGVFAARRGTPRLRRALGFASLIGLAGAVVALGPFLPLGTDYYANWGIEGGSAKVPLPGYLMFELGPTFRFFARAQVFVMVGVAVLAAAGLSSLRRRVPRVARWRPRRGRRREHRIRLCGQPAFTRSRHRPDSTGLPVAARPARSIHCGRVPNGSTCSTTNLLLPVLGAVARQAPGQRPERSGRSGSVRGGGRHREPPDSGHACGARGQVRRCTHPSPLGDDAAVPACAPRRLSSPEPGARLSTVSVRGAASRR